MEGWGKDFRSPSPFLRRLTTSQQPCEVGQAEESGLLRNWLCAMRWGGGFVGPSGPKLEALVRLQLPSSPAPPLYLGCREGRLSCQNLRPWLYYSSHHPQHQRCIWAAGRVDCPARTRGPGSATAPIIPSTAIVFGLQAEPPRRYIFVPELDALILLQLLSSPAPQLYLDCRKLDCPARTPGPGSTTTPIILSTMVIFGLQEGKLSYQILLALILLQIPSSPE